MISKLSNAGWLSPTMKIAAPRNISHCSATAALQTVEVNLESIAMSLFDDIFVSLTNLNNNRMMRRATRWCRWALQPPARVRWDRPLKCVPFYLWKYLLKATWGNGAKWQQQERGVWQQRKSQKQDDDQAELSEAGRECRRDEQWQSCKRRKCRFYLVNVNVKSGSQLVFRL